MTAIRARTASWPLLATSWWTVVSCGRDAVARRESSNPTTDRSSGTRRPSDCGHLHRRGRANTSEKQRTAVGRSGRSSSSRASASTESRGRYRAARTTGSIPAASSTSLQPSIRSRAGRFGLRDAVDVEGACRRVMMPIAGVPEVHEVLGGRAGAAPVVDVHAGCVRTSGRGPPRPSGARGAPARRCRARPGRRCRRSRRPSRRRGPARGRRARRRRHPTSAASAPDPRG